MPKGDPISCLSPSRSPGPKWCSNLRHCHCGIEWIPAHPALCGIYLAKKCICCRREEEPRLKSTSHKSVLLFPNFSHPLSNTTHFWRVISCKTPSNTCCACGKCNKNGSKCNTVQYIKKCLLDSKNKRESGLLEYKRQMCILINISCTSSTHCGLYTRENIHSQTCFWIPVSMCKTSRVSSQKPAWEHVISLALVSSKTRMMFGLCTRLRLLRPLPSQLSAFSTSSKVVAGKSTHQPVHPNDLHRAGGIASFMRLPALQPPKTKGELDVAFLGIPLDTATSNRPGAR